MRQLDVIGDLTAAGAEVAGLLDAARRVDGRPPLSDQLWLDLTHGGRPGAVALLARDDGGEPVGYAQISPGNDTSVVQLVVAPDHRTHLESLGATLLGAAADVVRTAAGAAGPGTPIVWWVADPTEAHERIADQLGWRPGRRLFRLRRSLPTGRVVDIETRPFRPGVDDDEWLLVNNRAFADHGEQGGWDHATLAQRLAEPWFDPDGFRVHERDGRMAGFCWTKLHHDADPVEGEIYVIAVDPDFHGLGLGSQLTLAGLESIERRGVDVAVLFVDADNAPALRLYEKLGFTVDRTDVAYVGDRTAPSPEGTQR